LKNIRGAIPTFTTPERLFQHSRHQIGYSNIQNTTEAIPTLKKHQRGYSNIHDTREVIPTFKTSDRLFQHSKHHRGYSCLECWNILSGVVNVGIAPLMF
jgi:hypothetical protein